MANLGQKNGIYVVRFRLDGREFKKSLKTRRADDARGALRVVEHVLHRLLLGELEIPAGVDPGDFVVSGGKLKEPRTAKPKLPSTQSLIEEYLISQEHRIAPSYRQSQAIHLRHLKRHLAGRVDSPCDQISHQDLEQFLQARLKIRDPNTVIRERVTLLQFYKWVVAQKHLKASPAGQLEIIKGGGDLPPFRTLDEVKRILDRGGLRDEEQAAYWECLYLNPEEIARLLATVRASRVQDLSYLLHAIPAYTGMRRGEVLRLKWPDVDFERECITARSRKQSRSNRETTRRIEIHRELGAELLAWREQRPRGQYVICAAETLEPLTNSQANLAFWQPMRGTEWCLNRARNWYKIGFHSYRHSFASNLACLGVDQRVIDEWMGHQTEEMRKRYRHLFPKILRSAMATFSFVQTEGQTA